MRYRDLKAANQKPWVWKPDKGPLLTPKEMTTEHLWNTLRMLVFNTRSPVPKRVGKFKRYPLMKDWNQAYVRRAISEFTKELKSRPGFDEKELFAILL